jgi:hypothetical protein
MASLVFNSFLGDVFAGNCNTGHTYKMTLHTSGYTEDRAAHSRFSSVTNELATGNGYTQGGATVTLSYAVNNTTNISTVTIGAANWPSSTLTVRKAVIRRARGGAASADELVAVLDHTTDVSSSGTTFNIAASTWTIPLPAPN